LVGCDEERQHAGDERGGELRGRFAREATGVADETRGGEFDGNVLGVGRIEEGVGPGFEAPIEAMLHEGGAELAILGELREQGAVEFVGDFGGAQGEGDEADERGEAFEARIARERGGAVADRIIESGQFGGGFLLERLEQPVALGVGRAGVEEAADGDVEGLTDFVEVGGATARRDAHAVGLLLAGGGGGGGDDGGQAAEHELKGTPVGRGGALGLFELPAEARGADQELNVVGLGHE